MMGNSRNILLYSFILAVGVIFLTAVATDSSGAGARETDIPEWTVLMFMAGDNNLEDAAIDDFNELETLGSTDEVNLIAQIDRHSGYDKTNGDWSDTRRYKITQDSDRDTMQSELLNDTMGDINMADPDNLADFLLWGVESYPAKRYLVVLWDHGLGWSGGVLSDKGTYMSIMQVREAFETVRSQWDHTFDLVGFDACLMGGIEVYYQLIGYANYSFGSGKNEPTDGLPYNDFIRDLVEDPLITEEKLLNEMAHDYVRSYRDHSPISVHYAGIDLLQLAEVPAAVEPFVEELLRQLPHHLQEVRDAWNESEQYEWDSRSTPYYYFDFIDFLNKLDDHIDNPRFRIVSGALREALQDAIVTHSAWSVANPNDTVDNSTGMTVYIPDAFRGTTNVPDIGEYQFTMFAEDSLWDEFLIELFNYNDEAYLNERLMDIDFFRSMDIIDSEPDGQLDSFSLTYNLSSVKGDSMDNLTLEVIVVTADGTIVHRQNITDPDDSSVIDFSVGRTGFDNYKFHVYVWDEDGVLQEDYGYAKDFQIYGVDLRITMDDGAGREIEPAVIKIKPDMNITLNLKVTNTGNSLELFQFFIPFVPLKYTLEYETSAFLVGPSETRILPLTIHALERISAGSDEFSVSVQCIENDNAEAVEFISLRVEGEPPKDETTFPEPYVFGLVPLIVILVVVAISTIRSRRLDKEMEESMNLPMDPEVEELLSFTRRLVDNHEVSIGPDPPPENRE